MQVRKLKQAAVYVGDERVCGDQDHHLPRGCHAVEHLSGAPRSSPRGDRSGSRHVRQGRTRHRRGRSDPRAAVLGGRAQRGECGLRDRPGAAGYRCGTCGPAIDSATKSKYLRVFRPANASRSIPSPRARASSRRNRGSEPAAWHQRTARPRLSRQSAHASPGADRAIDGGVRRSRDAARGRAADRCHVRQYPDSVSGREFRAGRESRGHPDGEGARGDFRRQAHLFGVETGPRGNDRSIRKSAFIATTPSCGSTTPCIRIRTGVPRASASCSP